MSKITPLAQQLIDKAIATQAKKLHLGRCGLTEIPEQVFEMYWLEELNMGNKVDASRGFNGYTCFSTRIY